VIRVTIAGAVLALLVAVFAGLTIDVSGAPERQADPNRCPKDVPVWCVFNKWNLREKESERKGKHGWCSIPGTFGGRWYCYEE
jgi:hypothetical protein